jgi:3-oxoacyl-[acyl-carrier-protein] synthase-1
VFDRLREGEADWVVIAGVDSYVSRETCAWLDAGRQLHTGYNAWGLVPGESAGAMVLASLPAAQAAGVRPLALVEGIGVAMEAVPITATEGVCLGWGLTQAVRAALDLLPPAAVVDNLYCDHNGQPYRADEMGFMLARAGDRFRDPGAFIAPADCWGESGAATVPLLVALILQGAARGYVAGPHSLVFAGSDSGQRVAMLLRTLEKEQSW